MPKLTFSEEYHQYFLGDIPIPLVSETISAIHNKIYGNIDSHTLAKAADKGSHVHRAIEFISKYKLNKFNKDISEYIKAYQKSRKEKSDWKLLNSELRIYHKALLYGMTIDEVYKTKSGIVLCNLKTTATTHLDAWSVWKNLHISDRCKKLHTTGASNRYIPTALALPKTLSKPEFGFLHRISISY